MRPPALLQLFQPISNQLLNQTLKIPYKILPKCYSFASRKISYPAASRNVGPILGALHEVIDKIRPNQILLEIASGTGQHLAHVAPHFPNITFYPSENDPCLLDSIFAYSLDCPSGNMTRGLTIDITKDHSEWIHGSGPNVSILHSEDGLVGKFDYVLNVNMIHITPKECTHALFRNTGAILKESGALITYGPYAINGVISPQSNVNFDRQLRMQNREWGLRDVSELKTIALEHQLKFEKMIDMPANNKILIWRKRTT